MRAVFTHADFDRLGWHDCHLWGIELRVGDAERGDWTSELALDIDYIVEWLCSPGAGGSFRVAPATLVFDGVSDLKIDIDWQDSGYRSALHPMAIDALERTIVGDREPPGDQPYYSWCMRLSWPAAGMIRFGAAGFTLSLRAEPLLTDSQSLPAAVRHRFPASRL
jgi:hypothetical protein